MPHGGASVAWLAKRGVPAHPDRWLARGVPAHPDSARALAGVSHPRPAERSQPRPDAGDARRATPVEGAFIRAASAASSDAAAVGGRSHLQRWRRARCSEARTWKRRGAGPFAAQCQCAVCRVRSAVVRCAVGLLGGVW